MISKMARKNRGQRSVRNLHHIRNECEGVSLDDPNLLDRLLSAAKRVHLPLRDELIVLIAGRYGASIRDILRLTIGDWQACAGQLEIRIRRQVSRGQGVMILSLSPGRASLLRAYIQGNVKSAIQNITMYCTSQRQTRCSLPPKGAPMGTRHLFLNGKPCARPLDSHCQYMGCATGL